MKKNFYFRSSIIPLLLSSGCYRYLELAAAPPSLARIVAQVTDTGSVLMANTIGSAAIEVEGVVAQASDSVWRLQLVRVDHRGDVSTHWRREEVRFPRLALTNVRERRLDRKRSWIAAGAVTVGLILASRTFGSFVGGGSTDGEPPPPP